MDPSLGKLVGRNVTKGRDDSTRRIVVDFDPFVAISNLFHHGSQGVRDYIVHEMFGKLKDEEVDFFAPQISVLLALWPSFEGEGLRSLVLSRSARSLHCALKFVWYFNAMAEYCPEDMKERCLDLSRVCEVAVVNSAPPDLSRTRPRGADYSLSERSSRRPSVGEVFHINPEEGDKRVQQSMDVLENRQKGLQALLDNVSDRIHALDPCFKPFPQPERKSSSNSYHRHMTTFSLPVTEATKAPEFALFLAKQKRAHFFTSQLDLFLQLEMISQKLVSKPREVRKDLLQKYLTVLDYNISSQGLYFPNCQASDPHYEILHIVADECLPLNSRDKVPFIMTLEVSYTGKCCSDPSIYETITDNMSRDSSPLKLSRKKVKAEELPQGNVPVSPFGELFRDKRERIRKNSQYANRFGWDLKTVIVKVGDDCRQEQLAMQMIQQIHSIFKAAKLPLRLRPFHVLVTSPFTGIIEVVSDAVSVDALKKNTPGFESLVGFFESHFGPRGTKEFKSAQSAFIESIAAYSIVTYLLQIKDRHNGNILLEASGAIVHIDFGFFLSNSPGGNWAFEQAPFKLTEEYVQVMEGEDSDQFALFKLLMIRGFLELRRHVDKITALAEILLKGPKMPCFYAGDQSIAELRQRFQADKSEQDCIQFVYGLIEESVNNWRSIEYDRYQRITNGIF